LSSQKGKSRYSSGVEDGAVGEDASEEDEMSEVCIVNIGG